MFRRILWQSFARQRGRKALAAAAVIAGMTVVTAMLSLRISVGDDLGRELGAYGANIRVEPAADSLPIAINGVDLRPAGTGAYLPEADLGKIKQVFWANNITAFAPELFVPVRAARRSAPPSAASHAVTTTLEGTYFDHAVPVPGRKEPFRTGIERLEPNWMVTGRWPGDASNQTLVGSRLAGQLGLRAGDTVDVATARGAVALTVTGILSTGQGQDNELVAPLSVGQQLAGQPAMVRDILVSALTKPEDSFAREDPSRLAPADAERWMCSPYAASIAREIQDALPGSGAHPVRPVAESEGVILSKLNLLMLLITLCALAASGLAIASAMTATVVERRDEIALMKAIGARDGAVGWLFICEAAVLGLGGGLAGYLLGELAAAQLARGVFGSGAGWNPVVLPLVLLLAGLVVIAGSWGALRRAARTQPAVILRGEA